MDRKQKSPVAGSKSLPDPPVPANADVTWLPALLVPVNDARDPELAPDVLGISLTVRLLSFHQKPAGSLPGDDRALARLLGYGADVVGFKAVRKRGCMRGWFKATDGRLYHPIMVAAVLTALEKRQELQRQTANARAAKAAGRSQAKRNSKGDDDAAGKSESPESATNNLNSAQAIENTTNNISVTDNVTGVNISRSIRVREVRKNELASFDSVPRGDVQPAPAALTATDQDNKSLDRKGYPRRNDPPGKWLGFCTADYGLDEAGVSHPLVRGFYLDVVCKAVCDAAGVPNPEWRGDWDVVARWLNDGFTSKQILDAIKARAAMRGFTPKATLRWFDGAVRDYVRANPTDLQRIAS